MVHDDTAKYLTEVGEWARDDVTMDRVGKSVLLYSFVKDGQNRGERADDKISHVESGQTFNVMLHHFMFENKPSKSGEGARNVFPVGIDVIPAFSVVEVAVNPANTGGYDEGWGINVTRIRPCAFSLYSMFSPVGLELLPKTYEAGVAHGEAAVQLSPGLKRVVDTKNIGFFSKVTQGSYLVKFGPEDGYRLVGPKVDPSDPMSRHLDVMDGGVFAVDISKRDLLHFTNASEEEEEDCLVYAQCLVDLASSAGALTCYVVHNEYLLRKDPNRSPYTGVPLIDSNKLLECVQIPPASSDEEQQTRFSLGFSVVNMDHPFLDIGLGYVDNNSAGEEVAALPCEDFVLASENARVRCAYPFSLGDSLESEIMRMLFVPKSVIGGFGGAGKGVGGGSGLERMDYRLLKKRRAALSQQSEDDSESVPK